MWYRASSFTFLGVSIGINPRRWDVWKPIMDKIRIRLFVWHNVFLSIGSRVVLNSVVSNILIFLFSFYTAPKVIINEIIMLQRVFLWGGIEDNKKINWVSWDKICRLKKERGLVSSTMVDSI